MEPTRDTRQLTWLLAWAVVFCDIGTSIYYVPGILYGNVGDNTPFFVLLTTLGFIPLALKYIEISWRNPEGGGVVTIATKAFGPMWGCLGGMLITTSYFLTAAISAVSGFHYIASVVPFIDSHIIVLACVGLVALAMLNVIGIRESATVALIMALAAFSVNLVVGAVSLWQFSPAQLWRALASFTPDQSMSYRELLVGFAAAWLAFSGLESISQLTSEHALPAAPHGALGDVSCDRDHAFDLAVVDPVVDPSVVGRVQGDPERTFHFRSRHGLGRARP